MMKIFYPISLFLLLFFFSNPTYSANHDRDTTLLDTVVPQLNFESNLDSMLRLWYVDKYVDINNLSQIDSIQADSIYTNIPDSLYINRLAKIPSVVNLTYNRIVRRYIEVYTVKRRASVEVMLGVSDIYFPIIDQIFDFYGIPNELKYMTVIESALNPRAYSRARAVGLWQFMYGTGRVYGLNINSFVDERMDPIKATYAAARYMSDLYKVYGDWTLVIAGYNCGAGNVNRAIRRSGGKRDYWDIYYYLPRETRGYVPAYIAATYVMNYYKQHNIVPKRPELPIACDTIMVNQQLHLKQVAQVLNLPIRMLKDLNPAYIRDIIPATGQAYSLTLPTQYTSRFIEFEDSIYHYNDSLYFNKNMLAAPSHSRGYMPVPQAGSGVRLYYTVKAGDNLGFIAAWYHVGVSDLRYWNGIYRNMIREGQKLEVYVPKNKADTYRKIDSMDFAEKQKSIGVAVGNYPANTPVASNTALPATGEFHSYTVRYGDTLWDIAKKFPGVSNTEIMQVNNLADPSKIKVGQVLRIPKKG
jgi:membrane-bound lytic murein transglycosylase D